MDLSEDFVLKYIGKYYYIHNNYLKAIEILEKEYNNGIKKAPLTVFYLLYYLSKFYYSYFCSLPYYDTNRNDIYLKSLDYCNLVYYIYFRQLIKENLYIIYIKIFVYI